MATKPKSQEIDIDAYLKSILPAVDKEIEKIVPRAFSNAWLSKTFGKPDFGYDADSLTKALAVPIWNLLDRGGKRWRPGLLILACESVGGKKETALKFTPLVELTHSGTLLVDDIEDSSEFRRGKPCIHKIFGVDIAVNAGNAMYYLPTAILYNNYYKLNEHKRMRLHDLVSQELLKCHAGQAMDIFWHQGHKYDVSENEYLQMCAYKTGTLARLAAKIGAVLGNGNEKQIEALGKFAETVGVAFQIQDDILNLVGEEFQKGKGVGEDIHEGKRTLMVIHCLQKGNPADKKRILEILNSHPEDQKTILEAIAILKKNGSIEYAREKATALVRDAWKKLDTELSETNAKQTLHSFADYLVDRKI
ncbi:MAG: polyprenyl synthetase family protein [Candidatus Micrarchaeota archaeon]